MILKTPSFWYKKDAASRLIATVLSPFSTLYGLGHHLHQTRVQAQTVGIPVICIGNLVAGGSGKTPTALALMDLVMTSGLAKNPCFLSRGYGGDSRGPIRVDPAHHTAQNVGDEPLLLARLAPTIISADRVAGALYAQEAGHDLIIMDDGLQNPTLTKNLSILVIDGASGFGNGHMIPAGPLRTPITSGMEKADIVLLIGADQHNVLTRHVPPHKTVLYAAISPVAPENPALRYVAFCGIAHPDKFRASLTEAGLKIAAFRAYADHYPYQDEDLETLTRLAEELDARLITTTKDAVRLPARFQNDGSFDTLPITLVWKTDTKSTLCQMITQL